MIDIGANLANEQFKTDMEAVIYRAKNHNLNHIILTATDLNSFNKNNLIIEKYKHILPLYNTLGLHPHHANEHVRFFNQFDNLMQKNKIISIGEFGLDYFRTISSKENQQITMNKFMEKTKIYKQPLFLHERDAQDDFISILKEHSHTNKKVVHCFTGDTKGLKKYLEIDCFIGITGWCTDKKRGNDLRKAIEFIPLDKLMIETDCPYLTPKNINPYTRRNEPSFLEYVAKEIASIKKIPLTSILEITYANSLDFFQLTKYNNIIDNKIKL